MLSERDEGQLMMALLFHPNRDEKIGPGFQGIKVNHKRSCLYALESLKTSKDLKIDPVSLFRWLVRSMGMPVASRL